MLEVILIAVDLALIGVLLLSYAGCSSGLISASVPIALLVLIFIVTALILIIRVREHQRDQYR